MLSTLSAQEVLAVNIYDDYARRGDAKDNPLWVDGFSSGIFRGISPDSEVVDVGCRMGRAIGLLPGLGINRYFGIDPSEESVRYCKTSFALRTGLQFAVGEVRTLGAEYPGRFSGFLMLAVLMHIPRSDLGKALSSLRKSLQIGAPGMFSTPMGEEGLLEVENHVGMLLTLYTPEELGKTFRNSGFQLVRMHSPDGNMVQGHVVAV